MLFAIRYSLGVVMLAVFILSSCNEKQSNNGVVHNTPFNNPPSFSWQNTFNPYDTIGLIHNQGLDYIISYRNSLSCNDTLELRNQIIAYSSEYICSLGWYSGQENCQTHFITIGNELFDIFNDMSIDEQIDNYSYDENSKIEIHNLINLVENNPDSNNIELVYQEIKDWETSIINSNYSINCKTQLLSASSIFRYSLHYWDEQRLLGNNSNWLLHCSNILAKKNSKIQNIFSDIGNWFADNWEGLVATAVADVAGYYVGSGAAYTGGVPVSQTGGTIGAIVFSASVAIEWDWK